MKKRFLRSILIGLSFVLIYSIEASAVSLVGDFNGDKEVDVTDLAILGTKYGTNDSSLDINKDGIVDIYDIVLAANQIQQYDYKVVDGTGIIKSGYFVGHLLDAVNQAKNLDQGTIFSNGKVIWDKNNYYLYNGETYINRATSLYQLNNSALNLNKGIILSKEGKILLDKSNSFKIKLGYTQENLYFRDTPSKTSTYSKVLPSGTIVELEYRTNGFYKIKYNDNGIIKEGYLSRYVDIFEDDLSDSLLGFVSEKYESNGDPGIISGGVGDPGGKSYGAWQLASKVGSVDNFLIWLKTSKVEFYNSLIEAKTLDGGTFSTNFDTAWKSLATNYYDEFYQLQRRYIKSQYYDALITKLNNSGIDYKSRLNSFAIRNMLWSLSVQHGVGGGFNITSIYKDISEDKNFINSIYDERSKVDIYFKSCSDAVKQAVKDRFTKEKADSIRIYDKETGY